MQRLMERLKKQIVQTASYFRAPERRLQASDMWRRLTLDAEHLDAIDREVIQVVSTKLTAVVANCFRTLMAVMQLLNWYSHKLFGSARHPLPSSFLECQMLHIAREARRYGSFDIGIEDMVIAALDLQK